MLQILHDRIIRFKGSLLGFDDLDAFLFSQAESNPMFGYLESIEQEGVGFIVAWPFHFFPEYEFEIEERVKEELRIAGHQEVVVLSLVRVKEPFTESTANITAPLVINLSNNEGRQIILQNEHRYGTRRKLLRLAEPSGSGGDAC